MNEERHNDTNPAIANPDVSTPYLQYERNPGAEYGEHIKNTTAIVNTSASDTYGNVLAVVEKYLLDLFPADTFKTVTTTTTLASRQLMSTPRQLIKRELPMMVLAPRIVFGQEDNRFLGHTRINERITNTFDTWGEGSLIPLAHDKKNKIQVHGHFNRCVLYIDVVLSFNTFMEQTDWTSYIHNMTPIGHNFFIRAPLELYLPDNFCNLLSKLSGVDVTDRSEDSVYNFLTYMNSIWYNPITYKLKGARNADSFFMYYMTDIDTVIQEPTVGPGIKDGQIRRNFDVSFTVRCEFNTIGYFTVNGPGIRGPIKLYHRANETIVPIFTDVFDINSFKLPVGWTVLGFPVFKLDITAQEKSISIDTMLNNSLRAVIDHHLKYGIPMDNFIRIQFRENGKILDDEKFTIDWKTRILTVVEPDYHRTYRLLITVSYDYVNNLIKELYNLE